MLAMRSEIGSLFPVAYLSSEISSLPAEERRERCYAVREKIPDSSYKVSWAKNPVPVIPVPRQCRL